MLISGDHALLEEMLTNLLENGIKYNHAGGYVRVRAEMADGLAVVTVADNGVGIAPEDSSAYSSASTAWTKAAASRPAARDWDCPSSSTARRCITRRLPCRARWARAQPSR